MKKTKSEKSTPIVVAGISVAPGTQETIDVDLGTLYTHSSIYMPVRIVHGRRPGPCLFVSAAIHGDELNGIEIIRRLLDRPGIGKLRGTLIAVPIVNVLGVINRSRYLPDRRDLNRSFPGSRKGSMAGRLANIFVEEIVSLCTHGIDLHTGAIHRFNLPQVRADLSDPDSLELARAFGAPVMLHANLRDGSLRQSAHDRGIPVLVYEAGEGLRLDEVSVRAGVRGIQRVMRQLGMLPRVKKTGKIPGTVLARSSSWVRAPISGVFRMSVGLGQSVAEGEELGYIGDPFGETMEAVQAPFSGIVIGRSNLPLAHEGDALFHVARVGSLDDAAARVEALQEAYERWPTNETPIAS